MWLPLHSHTKHTCVMTSSTVYNRQAHIYCTHFQCNNTVVSATLRSWMSYSKDGGVLEGNILTHEHYLPWIPSVTWWGHILYWECKKDQSLFTLLQSIHFRRAHGSFLCGIQQLCQYMCVLYSITCILNFIIIHTCNYNNIICVHNDKHMILITVQLR